MVRDQAGAILAQGGPYPQAYTQYDTTFCLPEGCYAFTVFDTYGDGICCGFGDGLYTYPLTTKSSLQGANLPSTRPTTFASTPPAGCTYPMPATSPNATDDDGSCDFESCAGCTNPDACNLPQRNHRQRNMPVHLLRLHRCECVQLQPGSHTRRQFLRIQLLHPRRLGAG